MRNRGYGEFVPHSFRIFPHYFPHGFRWVRVENFGELCGKSQNFPQFKPLKSSRFLRKV